MGFGQTGASGTIAGTITDSTGAILPNVNITVTNTATNATFNTNVQFRGRLQRSVVAPGTYTVTAQMTGFEKTVTAPFTLAVDQKDPHQFDFEAGAVTETLQVTAQAVTSTQTRPHFAGNDGDQVAAFR